MVGNNSIHNRLYIWRTNKIEYF